MTLRGSIASAALRTVSRTERVRSTTAVTAGSLYRWLPLAAILLGALLLRLYQFGPLVTFYPDSYAQLQATDNVLSGRFPIDYYYPPGIAIVLAPFFAVLPRTLATMQAAVLLAGLTIIVLSYLITVRWTQDRRAGLFLAAGVALTAPFVVYSRVILYDVINTLLIALSLFLAPLVARRGPAILALYGLLVFTTVTVRYTNVIVLPALFLASLPDPAEPITLKRILAYARSRAVHTVGLVVLGLFAVYLTTAHESITRFGNTDGATVVEFAHYPQRLGQYIWAALVGLGTGAWPLEAAVALATLPLAAIGARHLWRTRPDQLRPIVYLLIVWAPAHALYVEFSNRYALPIFFFVLLLAATGLSVSLRGLSTMPPRSRVNLATMLALPVVIILGWHASVDALLLSSWPPGELKTSREEAYDEIRSYLASLDGEDVTLLSSQALAVNRANGEIATYDVLRHAATYGVNAASVERLVSLVQSEQAKGRTVYYHYTEFEDEPDLFQEYELGLSVYFSRLQEEFSLHEVAGAHERPQLLYLVEPATASR